MADIGFTAWTDMDVLVQVAEDLAALHEGSLRLLGDLRAVLDRPALFDALASTKQTIDPDTGALTVMVAASDDVREWLLYSKQARVMLAHIQGDVGVLLGREPANTAAP